MGTVNDQLHVFLDAINELVEGNNNFMTPSPHEDHYFPEEENQLTFVFPENDVSYSDSYKKSDNNIHNEELAKDQESDLLELILNNNDFSLLYPMSDASPTINHRNYSTCMPTVPISVIKPDTPGSIRFEDDDEPDDTERILMEFHQPELDEENESKIISDKDLIVMPVRQLNIKLKNLSKEEKLKLKARRRLLKNRGYAQTCRERRICSQRTILEENEHLKKLLEQEILEKNTIQTKYNHLKNLIKKAKLARFQKTG